MPGPQGCDVPGSIFLLAFHGLLCFQLSLSPTLLLHLSCGFSLSLSPLATFPPLFWLTFLTLPLLFRGENRYCLHLKNGATSDWQTSRGSSKVRYLWLVSFLLSTWALLLPLGLWAFWEVEDARCLIADDSIGASFLQIVVS